ncbi:MAG: type III pantothenate kinase [Chitinophagaceae bacterium]|nr:MAG: type III pantothenate kinase [Chitinophagaceae bacterium]
MEKTLCLDFGNTRFKAALFDDRVFMQEIILPDASTDTIQLLINEHKPSKSILSSVILHPPEIEELLSKTTRFHKLGHTSKLSLTTPVGKPETIGADRLAMVAAAVINNKHEFLGGSISPGMTMRFRSMNEFTALLPMVTPEHHFPLVGYDTKTNLLSGVILGMSAEIDGIIDAYSLKYSNFNVLLTGGDMPFFVPHLKNRIFADPNLIYKGLYAISEYNNR